MILSLHYNHYSPQFFSRLIFFFHINSIFCVRLPIFSIIMIANTLYSLDYKPRSFFSLSFSPFLSLSLSHLAHSNPIRQSGGCCNMQPRSLFKEGLATQAQWRAVGRVFGSQLLSCRQLPHTRSCTFQASSHQMTDSYLHEASNHKPRKWQGWQVV